MLPKSHMGVRLGLGLGLAVLSCLFGGGRGFRAFQATYGEGKRIAMACDGDELFMECPEGSSIKVIEANYGRKRGDLETCNDYFQTQCDGERKARDDALCPIAVTTLRLHANSLMNKFDENVYCAREKMTFFDEKCNHRQTCTIHEISRESMEIGKEEDFCGKEKRYAIVEYTCREDQFIRPDEPEPPAEPAEKPMLFMESKEVKEVVAQKFAHRPEGEVEVAAPRVARREEPIVEITVGHKKTAIACDKEEMYLRCPADQYIKIVTANYGRKKGDMETCNVKFQSKCDLERKAHNRSNCPMVVAELKFGYNHELNIFDPNVHCAQEVMEIFVQNCNGHRECSFEQISRDVMKISPGTNFCGTETKYAISEYNCVKRVDKN